MARKTQSMDELFKGRHFEREIIVLCVRWYLRFKLSLRDLVEMMAERGLTLAHTTIMRWVQRRFARKAGRSCIDETYVKIRGKWTYLYRAVDREGQTVDFRLSANRDVKAAKAFFRKALQTQRRPPASITLDGYAASRRAVQVSPFLEDGICLLGGCSLQAATKRRYSCSAKPSQARSLSRTACRL